MKNKTKKQKLQTLNFFSTPILFWKKYFVLHKHSAKFRPFHVHSLRLTDAWLRKLHVNSGASLESWKSVQYVVVEDHGFLYTSVRKGAVPVGDSPLVKPKDSIRAYLPAISTLNFAKYITSDHVRAWCHWAALSMCVLFSTLTAAPHQYSIPLDELIPLNTFQSGYFHQTIDAIDIVNTWYIE